MYTNSAQTHGDARATGHSAEQTVPVSAMIVQPNLLALLVVCLQGGLAIFLAPGYATGSNRATSPGKSHVSDVTTDRSHIESSDERIQTTAVTPTNNLQSDDRNTSRFENRIGYLENTKNRFSPSTSHHQLSDDFYSHSIKQPHITSSGYRRPEIYDLSSPEASNTGPPSYHFSQQNHPNRSHAFLQQSSLYKQTAFDRAKHEESHQFASRIYPYKLGPDKVKPPRIMYSQPQEIPGGNPPQDMSPYSHELSQGKPSPDEIAPPSKNTHEYMHADHYHEPQDHSPLDYHDSSYDSYEYFHHIEETTTTTTTTTPPPPPPKKDPVVGHYRIGRKLFYIPLYAGIVFVAYVLLLIIKSIKKHKRVPYIFLTNPPERKLRDITDRVIRALETARQRYTM